MAYVKYEPGQAITANNEYYIPVQAGRPYDFDCIYDAGTATVTVQHGYTSTDPGGAPTSVTTEKLPYDQTASLAIAATGTFTGGTIRPKGDRLVFAVTSAAGLTLRINVQKSFY